jgi:hypothetical protein
VILTSGLDTGAVGNVPGRGVEQRRRGAPVPDLRGPVGISPVVRVARQAGGQLEETPVGDGVLHVIATLVGPDLPAQPAIAVGRVPARDLGVEDRLSEGQPGWFAIDFGIVELGGGDGGETPEDLVIISLPTTNY